MDSQAAHTASPGRPVASWYAQGLSDGLGDRLLMFDNSDAPSLELLRFRHDLVAIPDFEAALREQVHRLSRFQHPAFARARAVQRLEPDDDLALISHFVPGKRLSDVLHRVNGPRAAAALIRQLAPALALFQQHGGGTSHGLLNPDRIIVSPEGRLTIVEHVVGGAIDRLGLSAATLSSLGVTLPPRERDQAVDLGASTDWYQFGLIAVSALLGRPAAARDLKQLEELLDRAQHSGGNNGGISPVMRAWLDRALQLSGRPIESGADASASVADMLSHDGRSDRRRVVSIRQEPAALPPPAQTPHDLLTTALADDEWLNRPPADRLDPDLPPPARMEDAETDGAMLSFLAESEVASSVASTARVPPPQPVARDTRAGPIVVFPAGPPRGRAARTEARTQTPADVRRSPAHDSPSGHSPLSPYERRTGASARWSPPTREVAADTMRRRDLEAEAAVREQAQAARQLQTGRRGVASTAVIAALVLIVAAEAVVVAWLSRPYWLGSKAPLAVESGAAGENVLVTSRASEPAALRLAVAEDMAWVRVTSPAGEVLGRKAADASVGTVRIVSSIPIKVFEGPQLLGGAPGADLRLAPGRHELELVNAALGFRLAQTIDIEGGQAIAVHVAEPFGWVTLESSLASEVSIDGQAVGPTPLGPLALSLGEHTVIFKHASGVTDRQRVIVTSRSTTKVVAKLR